MFLSLLLHSLFSWAQLELNLCNVAHDLSSVYTFWSGDDICIPSEGQHLKAMVQTVFGTSILKNVELQGGKADYFVLGHVVPNM